MSAKENNDGKDDNNNNNNDNESQIWNLVLCEKHTKKSLLKCEILITNLWWVRN